MSVLRPVRTSVSIAIVSSSILSSHVRVFAWVDLCGLDRDPGNPSLVGGLDVDRIWIRSGFSPEMKLSCHNLICWKNTAVQNVEWSLECGREERIVRSELNTCLY